MVTAFSASLRIYGVDRRLVGSIHQAASHNFDLSIDSLIALKKANVPDAVVAAMQQASAPPAAGAPATPRMPDSKIPTPPEARAFYTVSPTGKLTMLEVGKPDAVDARKTLIDGGQVYYQLFGARSPIRFTGGNPVIVIKMGPKEKGFWSAMDKDNQFGDLYDMQIRRWEPTSGKREARFNTRAPHMGDHYDPEPGTFDFAILKIGTGFYKIVPVDPLVPGEYCTGLHRLPTDFERLYCFGSIRHDEQRRAARTFAIQMAASAKNHKFPTPNRRSHSNAGIDQISGPSPHSIHPSVSPFSIHNGDPATG